jgi:BCD family chlorophyll transporter-like MFS transporter
MIAAIRAFLRVLRIALPKIGVGWMFALLTIDFNRVAIVELGIAAVIVTSLLSVHHFMSPFQIIVGRLADCRPMFGYRRTPYVLIGSVVSSLLFLLLPSVAHSMAGGSILALAAAISLFVLFGLCMAMVGDSYHALIAEITTERTRGGVIAVVWVFTILSTILAAVVMNKVRPHYSPEAMQHLYNLTPLIVIGTTVFGIMGLEQRLSAGELQTAMLRARALAPAGNPLTSALRLLGTSSETRGFFLFIFVAIFSIFLQDNILEVFGAEVFGMGIAETTRFQPTWGGGVLLGMALMGVASIALSVSKKTIALIGCIGTAAGMAVLAATALLGDSTWIRPALFAMGLFTGFFNIGALSLMMDMTVAGATGLYMGLWGVAQAFATGFASIGSGLLHTALIDSGVLATRTAYMLIFGAEALGLVLAAAVLVRISVTRFRTTQERAVSGADLARAMDAESIA